LRLPPPRPAPIVAVAPSSSTAAGRLRFAVIGCGDIGSLNARAIARADNADLSVCHDADPALAADVASRLGGDAVATLEEALDPRRADAVFLSVPHDLHAPLVMRAASAGLHVVVEKPLGVDLATAHAAAAAARAAGVVLSVCQPYRYEPLVDVARSLVRAGAVGRLRGIGVTFHTDKPDAYWVGGFSGRAASSWRGDPARAGGGVIIMNLLHYLDLACHITGAVPVSVTGVAQTEPGAQVEDGAALSIAFDGGAIGSFAASASTPGAPPNRFELWGDDGTLRLEPQPAVYTRRAVAGLAPGRWTPVTDAPADLRRSFVERFVEAVCTGRPPDVTADEALRVQALIDTAYRSIEEGRPVAPRRSGRCST
jgi:predicted dehydrogenase